MPIFLHLTGGSLLTSKNDRLPRVLYCTDTYPPQVNGVSVVTARSVAGLRARGGAWFRARGGAGLGAGGGKVGVISPRYPPRPPLGVKQFVDDFGIADLHV